MPVPKQQRSRQKVRTRRGSVSYKAPQTVKCPKCGFLKVAHKACPECGTYKDHEVIDVAKRERRTEKKLKAQEEEE
ncbi:50S ribosomal protein L32 [bacterium]|nr:50S ribosomal protein L32 [bacterium]